MPFRWPAQILRPYKAMLVSDPAHPDISIARIYGGHFKQKGASAGRGSTGSEHAPQFQATNPNMWQTGEFAVSVPAGKAGMLVVLFPFSNYNNPETAHLTEARGGPPIWGAESWQHDNLNALPGKNFPRSRPLKEILANAAELLLHREVRTVAHFGGQKRTSSTNSTQTTEASLREACPSSPPTSVTAPAGSANYTAPSPRGFGDTQTTPTFTVRSRRC